MALRIFIACLLIGFTSASACAQEWGDLTGKFVYDGKLPVAQPITLRAMQLRCPQGNLMDESLVVHSAGGIANVVISVRTKNVAVAPKYAKLMAGTVKLDIRGCRFDPHILPVVTMQTLQIRNSEPYPCNPNLAPLGMPAANPMLLPGDVARFNFAKSQVVPTPVTCNVNPWMNGYLVIRDNPYCAISDSDGAFEIKDLPTGDLEFQVWQESVGYVTTPQWPKGRFSMRIRKGTNDLGQIKLKL
jgi:hypothetical protein